MGRLKFLLGCKIELELTPLEIWVYILVLLLCVFPLNGDLFYFILIYLRITTNLFNFKNNIYLFILDSPLILKNNIKNKILRVWIQQNQVVTQKVPIGALGMVLYKDDKVWYNSSIHSNSRFFSRFWIEYSCVWIKFVSYSKTHFINR